MSVTRVVVADDHPLVRQGVCGYLRLHADLEIVGEASSGEEVIRLASELQPDVVVQDLILNDLEGEVVTRSIKVASPKTQVLILTSYCEPDEILKIIKAGALSYLLKDTSGDGLVEAIRNAAKGLPTLHPAAASVMLNALGGTPEAKAVEALTARELEILSLVATGLKNASIADKLSLSVRTVKSHVSNILTKLGLADRTQAAAVAWRSGLVTEEDFENRF